MKIKFSLVSFILAVLSYLINLGTAYAVTPIEADFKYTREPGCIGCPAGKGGFNSSTSKFQIIPATDKGVFVSITSGTFPNTRNWSFAISPPVGEKLHVGRYLFAERAGFVTGRAPGLNVTGDGSGCNKVFGSFNVNQIATTPQGKVTMLDVDFVQRCEGPTAPKLSGSFKMNAKPLYFDLTIPGLGGIGEIRKVFKNATSIFSFSGTETKIGFSVSGLQEGWGGNIFAPTGQKFAIGTYLFTNKADVNTVGFDFGGCPQTIGLLTINNIQFDSLGKITGLDAEFEQHCFGKTSPIIGILHYFL